MSNYVIIIMVIIMKRVIIGIVGFPTKDNEDYNVVALYEDYKKMVVKKNCIPFIIPPIQNINYINTKIDKIPPLTEKEMDMYREMIDMCDGILLPGGSRMYSYYKFIINYAIEKDIPILGTCLGMQILACMDNEDYCLEKNIDDNHKQSGVKYAHKIMIINNTLLSKILDVKEIEVNSCHSYHITHLNKYIISAYSEDGLIEAIELPDKDFVVGVQWHPEKMIKYDKNNKKLISAFIGKCKKYKQRKKRDNK